MLLITDRSEANSVILARYMLPGSVRVANLETSIDLGKYSHALIFDVALDSEDKVRKTKALMQSGKSRQLVTLFLLRDDTNREIQQVIALGASSYLLSTTDPKLILERVQKLVNQMHASRPATELQTGVFAVGEVLELVDQVTKSAGVIEPTLVGDAASMLMGISEKNGIEALAECVLSYHNQTFRHSLLVSALTATFARGAGLSAEQCRIATEGALLHDVGKSLIPTAILDKPGKLTSAEMALITMHPVFGHEYLQKRGGFSDDVMSIVRHHHEYLDGSGYPDGLSGGQIPPLVRLVTICDIYAALVEPRAYKRANPPMLAYAILQGMKGKLDPDLLGCFGTIVRSHDTWLQHDRPSAPLAAMAMGTAG